MSTGSEIFWTSAVVAILVIGFFTGKLIPIIFGLIIGYSIAKITNRGD